MKQEHSSWQWLQCYLSCKTNISSCHLRILLKPEKCSTQSLQEIFPFPRAFSYSKLSSSHSYQASLAKIASHSYIHPTPVATHATNHLLVYSPYVCPFLQGRRLPAFLLLPYRCALNPTLTLHLQVGLIKGEHLAHISLQHASMSLGVWETVPCGATQNLVGLLTTENRW